MSSHAHTKLIGFYEVKIMLNTPEKKNRSQYKNSLKLTLFNETCRAQCAIKLKLFLRHPNVLPLLWPGETYLLLHTTYTSMSCILYFKYSYVLLQPCSPLNKGTFPNNWFIPDVYIKVIWTDVIHMKAKLNIQYDWFTFLWEETKIHLKISSAVEHFVFAIYESVQIS